LKLHSLLFIAAAGLMVAAGFLRPRPYIQGGIILCAFLCGAIGLMVFMSKSKL
jgi:hypothetical protein